MASFAEFQAPEGLNDIRQDLPDDNPRTMQPATQRVKYRSKRLSFLLAAEERSL